MEDTKHMMELQEKVSQLKRDKITQFTKEPLHNVQESKNHRPDIPAAELDETVPNSSFDPKTDDCPFLDNRTPTTKSKEITELQPFIPPIPPKTGSEFQSTGEKCSDFQLSVGNPVSKLTLPQRGSAPDQTFATCYCLYGFPFVNQILGSNYVENSVLPVNKDGLRQNNETSGKMPISNPKRGSASPYHQAKRGCRDHAEWAKKHRVLLSLSTPRVSPHASRSTRASSCLPLPRAVRRDIRDG
ncbi:hypothetical protein SARC_06825 [Sphaeroforma arctica JP610]|uniref:Uncharacterized protein n=1 Tax=Sphaeroforma arctica JP610 TaxID=667725 RepID=A0A0L0FVF8_9EUKA|nr:hypothetical protein SARC_06825 [Sphaeroforma arctica JP610]KNC80822.1 hypothetical protein SARC_06825 [Sphaeroforma arctica JP610]|eukprot:XP_014154724.1 hypothetical protein SARC_06825 [Sphaeroforma arctica JP610]